MTLDGTIVSARYYLGLAAEQDGQRETAAKIWRDLAAEAPAGAPWLSDVRNALARVENKPTPALAGPSAAQMAAAAGQPSEQQAGMIHGMVDRLAARLKQDGSDVAGWVQLIRSYNVLGESEKASAAAADAHRALASDPGKLEQLTAALKELDADHAAGPGPGADKTAPLAAAGAPPAHQDNATMQSMVDRLAERLKASGSDVQGWLMLVRSYATLGEKDKAAAAVGDARHALANDPAKLGQFNKALESFNIRE
jgi:cytochrome c-type biogenesis protein CcmH